MFFSVFRISDTASAVIGYRISLAKVMKKMHLSKFFFLKVESLYLKGEFFERIFLFGGHLRFGFRRFVGLPCKVK